MKKTVSLCILALASVSLVASCKNIDQGNDYSKPTVQRSKSSTSQDSKKVTEASAKKATRTSARPASSSMAFPTGEESTSAVLVQKYMPAEVQANSPFEYEILVTNLTPLSLENVVISEMMPANFRMSSSAPSIKNASMGSGNFELGTLAPHEARAISITGMATSVGSIDTCSRVDYNTGLCASTVAVQPALKVVASGPSKISICDEPCYTYKVTNTGSGMARKVVVTGSLPDGMRTADGSSSFSENAGDLKAGQSKTFKVCAKVSRKGNFQHKVSANATGGLKADSGLVNTSVTEPVLTITKTGPKKTYGGRNIKYAIVVTNVGDGVAEEVLVEDSVPSGTTFRSASDGAKPRGGKVSWKLGALAPGASRTLQMAVNAAEHGTVTNTARASDNCAKPVKASVTTEVVGIPAVLLEVVDLEDPIEVGENVTYLITVENQGTAPDREISIVCVLPPNVEYVSSKGSSTSAAPASLSGSTLTFPNHPVLEAKDKITFRVTVRAKSAADARFRVAMNTAELTSPVDETEATNYYE